ncbi:MAG: hypothetical protein A2V93_04795 [Ignavibacteria bacterium RBG_16_34_14]|nr:MAG: hypothetical protein A2V93_04795 [Ignavibacteria bacterium RBG_16_34_14]
MSLHSYTKIWLNLIWETHNRERLLFNETAKKVSGFLFKYSMEKNIYMNINYVSPEHVHSIIDLPANINIEDSFKLLKGASSHYINQERLIPGKFSWGRGYAAFSVSESQLNKVIDYIKNQKEHHKIKSFAEEYEEFLTKHNLVINR